MNRSRAATRPTPARRLAGIGTALLLALSGTSTASRAADFEVVEATIADTHAAISSGKASCRDIVQAYVDRARAYNGVCTALVTPDGKKIPAASGYVRAGKALAFPTTTVKASSIFPDLGRYQGLPLEYGEMARTASDPTAMTQTGMRVGLPDAGQLNALETLNIRGERSVTCKGDFDRHPSKGPLPQDAPAVCEAFRQQPDALDRAAELDAQFGGKPDLAALPMYCITVAVKDVYDTRDMRTTANNDVRFAMDVPPADSTIVARLRARGAIIYAKSVAHEFNGGPGDPGGPNQATKNLVAGGQTMGSWGGQSCNPYDTERVSRGSSGGSGVAVAANLVAIGICEQSGASCQGPASRSGIASLLTTKGLLPDNGGIGYQWFNDRAGIHARTLVDAVKVFDALRDPVDGYYDRRDAFTAVPKTLVPAQPYAAAIVNAVAATPAAAPLRGLRIAIVREHMVKKTANHVAISDQIDGEIKRVLRDQLGAELVELRATGYPDDPAVPDVAYGFGDALSELLPWAMPEIFQRRGKDGQPLFAVPGHDVTSYDYLLKLARRAAPLTDAVNIANFASYGALPCQPALCADFAFDIDRYLQQRGDARIRTWADWVEHAMFREDKSRAGARNWVQWQGHQQAGKADALARSQIARLALLRVMYENRIDVFVHPENIVPTPKIQGPNVGAISLDGITPFFQIPRVVVPAGVTRTIVEPVYALNEDRSDYLAVLPPKAKPTPLKHPLPVSITFFAGQGEEPVLIRVATAYESATRHRQPPPAFGPLR